VHSREDVINMYEGIKERIMRKLPELSSGQLVVAHFLLERMPEAAFMTAGELAEEVGVSESTVVRFASAIGYDGYPEMRHAIQEVMVEQFSPEYEYRKYLEATGKGESLGKAGYRRGFGSTDYRSQQVGTGKIGSARQYDCGVRLCIHLGI